MGHHNELVVREKRKITRDIVTHLMKRFVEAECDELFAPVQVDLQIIHLKHNLKKKSQAPRHVLMVLSSQEVTLQMFIRHKKI